MSDEQWLVIWTELNAADDLLVTQFQRRLDVMRKLRERPTVCRYYTSGGRYRAESLPTAASELRAASLVSQQVFASGLKNLGAGTRFALPPPAEVDRLLDKSTALGKSFTAEEWAALRYGVRNPDDGPSDSVFCAAMIKYYENLLALPQAEAAALIRDRWGRWTATDPRLPQIGSP